MRKTGPPDADGTVGRTVAGGPPANAGGADARPAEEVPADEEDDSPPADEVREVWVGAVDWMRFIDDATDCSALRAVWAVSLVLVPA